MKLLNIGLTILGIIVVFYILRAFNIVNLFSKGGLTSTEDASLEQIVTVSRSITEGADFTTSIWLYISDWAGNNPGEDKPIFVTDPNDVRPMYIGFDSNLNDIHISVDDSENYDIINVPLQKWFFLTVSLRDRIVDLYLDGKLVRTSYLDSVPKSVDNNETFFITPGGGFNGLTSSFKYLDYAVNPQTVYEMYKAGSKDQGIHSVVNKYGIKLSITQDNKEVGGFSI